MGKPPVATAEVLASLENPLILDVRDPNEVYSGKGGFSIPGCLHVPLNFDGKAQAERETTAEEFEDKIANVSCRRRTALPLAV